MEAKESTREEQTVEAEAATTKTGKKGAWVTRSEDTMSQQKEEDDASVEEQATRTNQAKERSNMSREARGRLCKCMHTFAWTLFDLKTSELYAHTNCRAVA